MLGWIYVGLKLSCPVRRSSSRPGMDRRRETRLRPPAELSQLRFQIRKAVGKRLTITLFAALFEIVQHPGAVQKQALSLLLELQFLSSESHSADSPVRISGVNLSLDRLTFPASGHYSLYAVYAFSAKSP
jgi:hypothetical protein